MAAVAVEGEGGEEGRVRAEAMADPRGGRGGAVRCGGGEHRRSRPRWGNLFLKPKLKRESLRRVHCQGPWDFSNRQHVIRAGGRNML